MTTSSKLLRPGMPTPPTPTSIEGGGDSWHSIEGGEFRRKWGSIERTVSI